MAGKQEGKSIKKKVFRILLNLVLVILALPMALTFLFRDPLVQTLSARMLTNLLTSQIGHEVRIERMKVNVTSGISIFGLKFKDHRGEPMLRVDRLSARPSYRQLGLLRIRFKKLDLEGVAFRYVRYLEDEDYSLIMLLDKYDLRDTSKVDEKPSGGGFVLKSRQLFLKDALFHFYDEHRKSDTVKGMDYADMRFENINLIARDFALHDDSVSLMIDSLATREKSGFEVKKLTSEFSIARSGLVAKATTIEMNRSKIQVDLEFKNKSYKTFAYFIDSVYMHGVIRPSTIDMSEIGFFNDNLTEMKNVVRISGTVSGPVRDMRGTNIRARFGRETHIHCDARITGLPDFYTSIIDAEIHELKTTACEVKAFRLPEEEIEIDYTEEFDCNDVITVKGDFQGSFYDFKTNLDIESGSGSVNTDIAFTMQEQDTLYFRASIKGDSVNLGKILHQEDILGLANLDLNVSGFGNNIDDVMIGASGMFKAFDLLDYRYSRMRMTARYFADTVKTTIRFGDRNLLMDAEGWLKLGEFPALYVDSKITRMNLDKIGLWKNSGLSFSGNLKGKMTGFDINTTELYAGLSGIQLDFGGDVYNLKQAEIIKTTENEEDVISLASEIVDLRMSGNYRLTELPLQLMDAINSYYDFVDTELPEDEVEDEYVSLDLNFKKTNLLGEQFLGGTEISTPLSIQGRFSYAENSIYLKSSPEKIVTQGIQLVDNNIILDAKDNLFDFSYNIADVIIKDSSENDKSVLGLDDFRFGLKMNNDSLTYGIHWSNRDTLYKNTGDLLGYLATVTNITKFKVTKSEIFVNDTLWTINPDNLIVNDSSGLYFNNLDIFGGQSMMTLSGKYPQREGDQFKLSFKGWNLSNFDFVTSIYNIDLDGIADGDLELTIVSDNPAIVSDLTLDKLHFNKEYLGTARLLNTWDNTNRSIYVKSQIVRQGNSGRGEVLSLNGYYYPFLQENSIDLKILFNRLKLAAIEPLVAEFVSQIEGQASGNLHLTGTPDNPVLIGEVDMRRAALNVNYLNTRYSFSNKINFQEKQLNFNELMIFDTLGNSANISGTLKHDYFRNSRFDVKITTDQLMFFNTTRKMNDLYYGTAIASGDILVSGSLDKVKLDMNIKSGKGTDVTLPLDYSLELSDKDYIIFLQPKEDSIDFEEEPEGKLKEEDFAYAINLGMGIDKNARIRIFLPSDMGRIESRGTGDIFMHSNSTGDFTLRGTYRVESGTFNFALGNLVSKRFDLVRGGRITWTGDPYTANVNIKGLYRLRANLSSLGVVLDDETNYRNNVNVHCYITLTNQLLNPDIRFQILFPNLRPEIQRMIYAELDTTNLAVMNEQMISLLVLGSFSASNASNINMSSAYFSVMTNQLSSMLSKISEDFDIGINYKPGDENYGENREEFEVALSTQLLDDRLIIDGQFGMTYDRAPEQNESSVSNIVGDVDVGYLLTKDGRWILKAFNHSNVNTWYATDLERIAPYTQGVGIAYRKEFTNIAELFKRTRPRKNDNAVREDEEEEEPDEINDM